MPIQHAVLSLLSDGESYGYELRAEFERAIGPQWGQLNIGHLYQVLDRLVRDGLVTRHEVEQRRLPDRVVYRLTKAGRDELERWLETPFVRQSGYRDDFFLKLLAASRLGRKQLDVVLRTQRSAYLAELGRSPSSRRPQGGAVDRAPDRRSRPSHRGKPRDARAGGPQRCEADRSGGQRQTRKRPRTRGRLQDGRSELKARRPCDSCATVGAGSDRIEADRAGCERGAVAARIPLNDAGSGQGDGGGGI